MGSEGGQVKGRGQCKGRCASPIKAPVPVPSLALYAMPTLPSPTSSPPSWHARVRPWWAARGSRTVTSVKGRGRFVKQT